MEIQANQTVSILWRFHPLRPAQDTVSAFPFFGLNMAKSGDAIADP
jgi:hypothetical protein